MKKILIGLTCLALMFSVAAFVPKTQKVVFAESEITQSQTSKIEVVGTGEVKVEPDTAIINVGVETINQNANLAESENSDKINAIINTLISNGVARENIKTSNYHMYKKYDYQSGQVFVGYQVTNMIEVKVDADFNVSNLLTELTNAGVTNVSGVNYVVSNKEVAYNNALDLALENARAKAQVLAGGRQIKIVKVEENNCYNGIELARYYSVSTNDGHIEKGEITIKACVKVKFEVM